MGNLEYLKSEYKKAKKAYYEDGDPDAAEYMMELEYQYKRESQRDW